MIRSMLQMGKGGKSATEIRSSTRWDSEETVIALDDKGGPREVTVGVGFIPAGVLGFRGEGGGKIKKMVQ